MDNPPLPSPTKIPVPSQLKSHVHWADHLVTEFTKETDRAAVILATSIFESRLDTLLRRTFAPTTNDQDELLDGPLAPLSNLSSKIDAAYRLGLISLRFARDLHTIRRIRNLFAHNLEGCTFEQSSVKIKVEELRTSSAEIFKSSKLVRLSATPPGTRRDFLLVCSWMLWALESKITEAQSVGSAAAEFGYFPDPDSEPPQQLQSPTPSSG